MDRTDDKEADQQRVQLQMLHQQ